MNYLVGKPKIYNEPLFMNRVQKILNSCWFSNHGPFIQELEKYVSKLLGVNHVIAVSNATIGLELCLELIEKKGKIITPSFTFVGTLNAISSAGHTPVFTDIDDDYLMVNPEQHYTEDCVGIMPVDLFGSLLPLTPRIKGLDGNYLPVIYDSAHAFMVGGEGIGVFGEAMIYSFHPTKIFGGMELGLIVTDRNDWNYELRNKINFGFLANNSKNLHGEVVTKGTNAKASEIAGAAVLTQIEERKSILEHYSENHLTYSLYLPKWIKLRYPNVTDSNFSYIVCEVEEEIRDSLLDYLHKNKIFARKYFTPNHLEGPYKQDISLPNTERLAKRIFQLPSGLTIGQKEIIDVCSIIYQFIS